MDPVPEKSAIPRRARPGTPRLKERGAQLAGVIESFCRRTNDGLAVVAIVLALVLVISAIARNPEGLAWPTRDAETGLDGNDPVPTLDGLLAP